MVTEDQYIDYLPTHNIQDHLPIQILDKLTGSRCLFLGYRAAQLERPGVPEADLARQADQRELVGHRARPRPAGEGVLERDRPRRAARGELRRTT